MGISKNGQNVKITYFFVISSERERERERERKSSILKTSMIK